MVKVGMTIKEIIDGLQFTIDMFLFDPSTGEIQPKHLLNEDSRLTVDACEGAIDIMRKYQKLEQEPTTKNDLGVDAVSRKAVINQIFYSTDNNGDVIFGSTLRERIARLPSVTPQLSSGLEKNSKKLEKNFGELDCISRADALDCVNWGYTFSDVYKKINELPSVTPQEPKTGHWIDINYHHYYNDGDIETTELRCSCCNKEVEWDIELLHKPYYCENCGAKMVEPQESEDKE